MMRPLLLCACLVIAASGADSAPPRFGFETNKAGQLELFSDRDVACLGSTLRLAYGETRASTGKVCEAAFPTAGIRQCMGYARGGLLTRLWYERLGDEPEAAGAPLGLGRYELVYDGCDRVQQLVASDLPGGRSYSESFVYDIRDHLVCYRRREGDGQHIELYGYDAAHNRTHRMIYDHLQAMPVMSEPRSGDEQAGGRIVSLLTTLSGPRAGAEGVMGGGVDLVTADGAVTPVRIELTPTRDGVRTELTLGEARIELHDAKQGDEIALALLVMPDDELLVRAYMIDVERSYDPHVCERVLQTVLPASPLRLRVVLGDGGAGALVMGDVAVERVAEGHPGTLTRWEYGLNQPRRRIDPDRSVHVFHHSRGGLLQRVEHQNAAGAGLGRDTVLGYSRTDMMNEVVLPDGRRLSTVHYGMSADAAMQELTCAGDRVASLRFQWSNDAISGITDRVSGQVLRLATLGGRPLWCGGTDTEGRPFMHTYIKNPWGDVVGIYAHHPQRQIGLIEWRRFDPWGEVLSVTAIAADGSETPARLMAGPAWRGLRYEGMHDAVLGCLYPLRGRVYASGLGRFVQPSGSGHNRYVAGNGDPVNSGRLGGP